MLVWQDVEKSWSLLSSDSVFPKLLKVAEHLKIKLLENPSYLQSKFIFQHNILGISNFWGSTSRLLVEHLWSPEQWLGTTGLFIREPSSQLYIQTERPFPHCCHMAEGCFEGARERQVIFETQSWVPIPHNDQQFISTTSLEQTEEKYTMVPFSGQPLNLKESCFTITAP